jgi:uncharacterized protein YdaU (DUF1376 family)
MLRLVPSDARYALKKAAAAREKARSAMDGDLRQFWQRMEVKWLALSARVNDSLAFVKSRRK